MSSRHACRRRCASGVSCSWAWSDFFSVAAPSAATPAISDRRSGADPASAAIAPATPSTSDPAVGLSASLTTAVLLGSHGFSVRAATAANRSARFVYGGQKFSWPSLGLLQTGPPALVMFLFPCHRPAKTSVANRWNTLLPCLCAENRR